MSSSGFQIRRWDQTTLDMISWLQANPDTSDGVLPSLPTDLTIGSLERGHLEAVGLVLEEYDVRTASAIKWAVSESAFTAFGFSLLPAQAATGGVVFQCVTAPTTLAVSIPAGTKLIGSDGSQYLTTADGSILVGTLASASVPVVATVPGVAGNVAAGVINQVGIPILGVDAVQNPSPLTGGSDAETPDARMNRFQGFISTLQRGTADALEFAAMSTGVVSSVKVVEPFAMASPPAGTPFAGLVWLVVDIGSQVTTLPAGTLSALNNAIFGYIDGTGRKIPGWKAAGIRVVIIPVTYVSVKVRASVTLSPTGASRWSDIQTALNAALAAYFATLQVTDAVSYANLLVALAAADPDILKVVPTIWLASDAAPNVVDPIFAADVTPLVDGDAYAGATSRAVVFTGSAVDGGVSITYPQWIQA